jgi:hypothetical protein
MQAVRPRKRSPAPERKYPVTLLLLVVLMLGISWTAAAQEPPAPATRQLRVFLDCGDCYSDYLRSEITFVDYVRDRAEADVHLLITSTSTGSGGQEYTAEFIGLGRFDGVQRTLKAITTTSDSDDIIRRQIANTVRLGMLAFIAKDGVPQQLDLRVDLGSEDERPAVTGDRWRNWVFSVRGSASLDGEESRRQWEIGGAVSADRITPDWKITLGTEFDHEHERFNIDEEDEEPFEVERRERDFNWLVVKGLGEHWSVGAMGDIESSTFENTSLGIGAAPAIEYNFFPYSQYTRRQLRVLYSIGPRVVDYYEETLFGKMEETLAQHELSATFDRREPWGTLEARVEWSQYLHDLGLSRLQADGEVSWRILRGLSVTAELNASRIRDQLSLPSRGATPEEILLELRELRSGYEYEFSFGLTYTFGSIFSSVVNPRFGQ